MGNLIDNRQIRVFISSTFRDMQDERDYLMKRTFPKLRKLAAERDVTLTEIDLRWGITKNEGFTWLSRKSWYHHKDISGQYGVLGV